MTDKKVSKDDAKAKGEIRAYEVNVSGQLYYVEVKPTEVGAKISSVTPASAPVAAPPAMQSGRPAPLGGSEMARSTAPARPAPAAAPRPSTAPASAAPAPTGGTTPVKCPMQGTIMKILVKLGDAVERGQKLGVFEAMKMENDILAPVAGTVAEILVKEGDSVAANQDLIILNT